MGDAERNFTYGVIDTTPEAQTRCEDLHDQEQNESDHPDSHPASDVFRERGVDTMQKS